MMIMMSLSKLLDIPVYVISLRSAVYRQRTILSGLQGVPDVSLVRAMTSSNVRKLINGDRLTLDSSMRAVGTFSDDEPYERHQKKQVLLTEIACTMSHVKAFETALADNVGAALILEDDMNVTTLSSRLTVPITELLSHAPVDWDILQLHMLHSEMYDTMCAQSSLFRPWEKDLWSTGAYVISNHAMQYILAQTRRNMYMPAPIVADHLIFALVNSYTFTRPILHTAISGDTSIQTRNANFRLTTSERGLWDRIRRTNHCSMLTIPTVQANNFLFIVTAKRNEQAIALQNAAVMHKTSGFRSVLAITCVDRMCSEWNSFRSLVSNQYELRVVLHDDGFYTKGGFHSKFLAQIQVFKMMRSLIRFKWVMMMDGDIDLFKTSFDLHRYVQLAASSVLSQPIVDVTHAQFEWGGQWFRPLNTMYWEQQKVARPIRCSVPHVEHQVFMADADFVEWFINGPEVSRLVDMQFFLSSDWGHDWLWCRAAESYNSSRIPCYVVPSMSVYHHNTRSIVKDSRFRQNGDSIINMLKPSAWYVDPKRSQDDWTRSRFETCTYENTEAKREKWTFTKYIDVQSPIHQVKKVQSPRKKGLSFWLSGSRRPQQPSDRLKG